MTHPNRQTLLAAIAFAALALAAVWCAAAALEASDAARRAAADVADCERYRDAIVLARAAAPLAREHDLPTAAFAQAINDALAAATIDASALVRPAPAPPARVAGTAYEERPTRLTLRDVSLAQTLRFVLAIRAGGSGLGVQGVRLTATKAAPDADSWDADVTVSYLVYSDRAPDVAANVEER